MPMLTWGEPGTRKFETGIDRGVLFTQGNPGVAWAGLISFTETPQGGDVKPFYMDGIRYQNRQVPEEFGGTLEAYMYPDEFARCDGTLELDEGFEVRHQPRRTFGLSYRTRVGNDLVGEDYGYKIHLIYNALAQPTQRTSTSIGENPDADNFSWELSALPVIIPGARPSAHLVIDSRKTPLAVLAALEVILYGSDASLPYMPSAAEIIDLYAGAGTPTPFTVTLLDDGVFEVTGSDQAVQMVDEDHFQLSHVMVVNNNDGSYTIGSGGGEGEPGTLLFTVTDMGNGVVKYSGPDDVVFMSSATRFTLNSPHVTNLGDGSFEATSAPA